MADSGTLGSFKLIIDMNPDATLQAFRGMQDAMKGVSESFEDVNEKEKEQQENISKTAGLFDTIRDKIDETTKKLKDYSKENDTWLGKVAGGLGTISSWLSDSVKDLDNWVQKWFSLNGVWDFMKSGLGTIKDLIGNMPELVLAGGEFSEQKTQFENFASSFGMSGSKIITKIQEISQNTISLGDSMKVASTAIANGFSEQQMGTALTYAKRFSEASGRSFEEVSQTMVSSMAKGRFAALAEFGIIAKEGDKLSDLFVQLETNMNRFGNAGPNIADSWSSLKNTWTEFRLELGAAINASPALSKMFADLAQYAFDFVKAIDFTVVTRFVEGVIRGGQTLVTAFYEPVKEVFSKVSELFWQFVTPFLEFDKVATDLKNSFLDAIIEMISGSKDVIGGFKSDVSTWFSKLFDFEPTEEGFKGLIKHIIDGLAGVMEFGANMWNGMLDGISLVAHAFGSVGEVILVSFAKVVEFLNYMFNDLIPTGFEKMVEVASTSIFAIGDMIPDSLLDLLGIDSEEFNRDLLGMKENIDGWAGSLTADIRKQGEENKAVINGFVEGVQNTTDKMATAFDGARINTDALHDSTEKVKKGIDGWGPLYEKQGQAVKQFTGVTKEELEKQKKAEEEARKEALEIFKEVLKDKKDAFVENQKSELDAFKKNQDEQKRAFQDQQKDAADAFKERQKTEADAFKDNQKEQSVAFKRAQDDAKKIFTETQKDAADAFKQRQNDEMDEVKRRLNEEKKAFQEQQKDAAEAFKSRQADEKEAFTSNIKKQADAFKDAQADQLSAFKKNQSELLETFKNNQKAALDALKERLKTEKDAFKDAQKAQLDQLKDRLADEKRAFKDRQDAAKDAYKAELDAARSAFEKIMDERKKMDQRTADDAKTAFERTQEDALTKFQRQQEDELAAFKSKIQGRDDEDALLRQFERQQDDALTKFQRSLEDQKTAFERTEEDKRDAIEETYKREEEAFKKREDMQLKVFEERQAKEAAAFDKQQQITLDTLMKTQEKASAAFDKLQEKTAKEFETKQAMALNAFTEQQQRQADDFADRQQAALQVFEEKQKAQISSFDKQQKAAMDAFEKGQQRAADAFEQQQESVLKSFETRQQDELKAFDKSQQAAMDAFTRQQEDTAAAFEKTQRDEARAFEKNQQDALKAFSKDQEDARRVFEDGQKSALEAFQKTQRESLKEFERNQKEQLKAFEDGKGVDRELQKAMVEKYLKGSEGVAGAIGDYTKSLKNGVKVFPSGAAVNGALQELIEFVISRAVERAQEENIPVAGA